MRFFQKGSQTELFAAELASLFVGERLSIRRDESQWSIIVGSAFMITTYSWRLIGAKSIIVTNEDDGHQFGLPEPIDAETKANQALAASSIAEFNLDGRTGDCKFRCRNAVALEVLTMSRGYETWQVYRQGEFFGAVANGGLV